MGCGSSSLKGDAANDIIGDEGQPAKKVRTNFTDVDFSSGAATDRRGTMNVAPDEQQRRHTKASRASAEVHAPAMTPATALDGHPSEPKDITDRAKEIRTGEATLEPYKSMDGAQERIPTSESTVAMEPDVTKKEAPGLDFHLSGTSGHQGVIA